MYSTGALTGEVLHLKVSDFDSELRVLALSPKFSDRYRQIPVSVDLKLTIDKYLKWRSDRQLTSPYLLVTKRDSAISRKSLVNSIPRCLSHRKNCSRHPLELSASIT